MFTRGAIRLRSSRSDETDGASQTEPGREEPVGCCQCGRKSVNAAGRGVEVFAGSNGDFYTPSQIRRRCRAGTWQFCLYEGESGRLLFETAGRSLVVLSPVTPTELPPWVELRIEADVALAVDTRRGTGRSRPMATRR